METNVKLGKIWGIPIGLNRSWFIIFGFMVFSLGTGFFTDETTQLPVLTNWTLALVTSLLLFGSVLFHELGHALLALRNRIPVKSITLFFFGGVAQIEREPETPGAEFRIAIAGPLASLTLAMSFGGLWLLSQDFNLLAVPSMWLARVNLTLAIFNLIPGFPLDGGRIFRAIIWKLTGKMGQATRLAANTGRVVAFGFMGFGVLNLIQGNFSNGLWFIFIGWFLQNAASSSYVQSNLKDSLEGVPVQRVMTRDFARVTHLISLRRLIDEYVLARGTSHFVVTDGFRTLGLLSLRDIAAIPQRQWPYLTAEKAMTPIERITAITPDTELLEALHMIERDNLNGLPVVEGGEVIGTLSRMDILRYLDLRRKFGTG